MDHREQRKACELWGACAEGVGWAQGLSQQTGGHILSWHEPVEAAWFPGKKPRCSEGGGLIDISCQATQVLGLWEATGSPVRATAWLQPERTQSWGWGGCPFPSSVFKTMQKVRKSGGFRKPWRSRNPGRSRNSGRNKDSSGTKKEALSGPRC